MGNGQHEEGQRIQPVEPIRLRTPGGEPTGQQTDQRRQPTAPHHHITAGGVGHIAPDRGADGTGQAGGQHEAAQQQRQRGLLLGHQHQERRGQRRRHQQGAGDHKTAERGIGFQQAQTAQCFLEGVIASFPGPRILVYGKEHASSHQPGHPCRRQQRPIERHGRVLTTAEDNQ